MLTFIVLLTLAGSPVGPQPGTADPRTVQCTAHNRSDGKDRKCRVRIPRQATLLACTASDKAAGHCVLDPQSRVVAWTVGEKGAQCRLVSKKTDWKKKVTIKVAKATPRGGGSCTLFVGLQ
ncbi:MAG TPA: hypothetical protein VHM30_19060 [Gemmatimonadaceae bacterium]|nr:hypothetical protein [Gemmatimonadaceae bacterium]